MAKDNITLEIRAKDLASKAMKGVSASGVALGTVIGNLSTKMISGALNGMRSWVNEALQAEKANVMLDAALRGTGTYTVELSKRYKDLANAIQNETGASDESVKSNIAALATMGVGADKMDKAARSAQALASLGRDGSLALVAVARAMEGDITAFERFAPEVKNALTLTEKVAAANRLIAAGYEQQTAQLQTVGGAWEALKGRLGDAREELLGAVFEGAKIGTTFNDAQAALGAFLQGERFAALTARLRDAAAYAADIGKALTDKGGFVDVAKGVGNVILAAFLDGGEAVGKMISAAMAGKGEKALISAARFSPIALAYLVARGPKKGAAPEAEEESRTAKAYAELAASVASHASAELSAAEITEQELARGKKLLEEMRAGKQKNQFVDLATVQQKQKALDTAKDAERIDRDIIAARKQLADQQKQQAQDAAKDRAEKAKGKADTLWQEFVDPAARARRIESEQTAAAAEARYAKMLPDVQRLARQSQNSAFKRAADYGLSADQKQVYELMQARDAAKTADKDYAKATAENTKGLAQKLDELLKMKG